MREPRRAHAALATAAAFWLATAAPATGQTPAAPPPPETPAGAAGGGGAAAVVNAVAYQPLPPDQPVFVRVLDNSKASAELKQRFEQALRDRGVAVSESPGPLVLTVEPSDEPGAWSADDRALGSGRSLGERTRPDFDRRELSLQDAPKGGVLNRPAEPTVSPGRYRLDARLEDRTTGRTLWHGWSTASIDSGDGGALVLSLVPGLAGQLGRTVRAEAVPLP